MSHRRRTVPGIRIFAAVALAALLATPGSAYYHYVHFGSRNAPFNPQFERFNLAALPNNTVTFFVSDQGPGVYAPGDNFGSLLGQVKQALAAWDSISTSNLRVAFGGLENSSQVSNTPGGDVTFTDLPPGLYGLGFPTSNGTTIVSGKVMLANNTNAGSGSGPTFRENYFTTAVHEIGHALGLQHTWTGSAMSVDIVRSTSRARPFDADDVAAINLLYGKDGWQSNYGSIAGRVTQNGNGVSMASVVALSPTGPAISSLTNPDGTYRIDGIPANNYLVYVHPLPPDAIPGDFSGLRPPQDQNGNYPFQPGGPFGTQFFPGTTDPQLASLISVARGSTNSLNFSVQGRNQVPASNLYTSSFLDPATRASLYDTTGIAYQYVTPAFISSWKDSVQVKIQSANGDTPVPQSAVVLGGFAAVRDQYIRPFPDNNGFRSVALFMFVPPFAGAGPRHLVLNYGNDILVIPQAINLVPKPVPAITSVNQAGENTVTVTGSGLGGDTRIFFDGIQAVISGPFTGNDQQGSITVIPPPGIAGQTAAVTAFNGDGQNTTLLPSPAANYTYSSGGPLQFNNVSLTSLAGPALAMVDIVTQGASFVDGQVTLGFGSDDVVVKRVWVLGPNHIQANVAVAPGAVLASSEISVISGFQVMWQRDAFQTLPAAAGRPLISAVTNGDPRQQTIYPGSTVTIFGQNLANAQVTLNDTLVPVQFNNPVQINITVPGGFPTGPAVLKVSSNGASPNPVLVQIDVPPPSILNITNVSGTAFDANHFASVLDLVNVLVANLDQGAAANPNRVQVSLGGILVPVTVQPMANNQYQLQFVVPQAFGGIPVPLAVVVDGSASNSVLLTVK